MFICFSILLVNCLVCLEATDFCGKASRGQRSSTRMKGSDTIRGWVGGGGGFKSRKEGSGEGHEERCRQD